MDEKIIDLSDSTQYPASVLADLNYVFALGDDSQNMQSFLQHRWMQPTFHWGWNDITHEEAVKSDFLYRAFSQMNIQNKKKRDAMIASEGYKFVWKDKSIEPLPGILSGDMLCELLNRVQERDMISMKDLNEYEEREARRWHLNPTYDDLMKELEKNEDDRDFGCTDKGCGMLCFWNKAWGNKQKFLVNTKMKKSFPITSPNGYLVGFTHDDIDWDNVNQLEHNDDAHRLQASYYFGIDNYEDGIARVDWMLYPDGRYFADEDGFGMEDNDEVNVSAFIDTECRVLVKFQDMEDSKKARKLYQEALRKNKENRK